jgi:hypothetical protein
MTFAGEVSDFSPEPRSGVSASPSYDESFAEFTSDADCSVTSPENAANIPYGLPRRSSDGSTCVSVIEQLMVQYNAEQSGTSSQSEVDVGSQSNVDDVRDITSALPARMSYTSCSVTGGIVAICVLS